MDVTVQIGDTIEFTRPSSTSLVTTGRIVEVSANDPWECVVQISPYEPLQTVHLQDIAYKILYDAGDMKDLPVSMVGLVIEIMNTETQEWERAIVKRVDMSINCALLVFASGKKEWVDVTLAPFKIIGKENPLNNKEEEQENHSENRIDNGNHIHETPAGIVQEHVVPNEDSNSSATFALDTISSNNNISSMNFNRAQAVGLTQVPTPLRSVQSSIFNYTTKQPPTSSVEDVDWYTDGGFVELCDRDGAFLEGAILCTKTAPNTVQLYNERRQFFEISVLNQPFKVVIHGLVSMKTTIPMGQTIDVYSPMSGAFRNGKVIKTGEVGRLTPIRFSDSSVEWLDLSTQTFKIVFLEPPTNESSNVSNHDDTSPTKATVVHHIGHKLSLQCPLLYIGDRIELFDGPSRQYIKYNVCHVSDAEAHKYTFEPQVRSATTNIITGNLTRLRCRIPLQASHWPSHRPILAGHRVDVYDKQERTVVSGKIVDVGPADEELSVLVRYKDGSKMWVDLQRWKLKLRLHGDAVSAFDGARVDNPESSPTRQLDESVMDDGEQDATEIPDMWDKMNPHEQEREDSEKQNQMITPTFNKRVLSRRVSASEDVSPAMHRSSLELMQFPSAPNLHASAEVDSHDHRPSIAIQPLDFTRLRGNDRTKNILDSDGDSIIHGGTKTLSGRLVVPVGPIEAVRVGTKSLLQPELELVN